jgi:transposase
MEKYDKIVDIFLQNPGFTQPKIARIVGVSRMTVNRAIGRYKYNISLDRKPGSGRKNGPVDKKMENKVVKTIERLRNASLNKGFGSKVRNLNVHDPASRSKKWI